MMQSKRIWTSTQEHNDKVSTGIPAQNEEKEFGATRAPMETHRQESSKDNRNSTQRSQKASYSLDQQVYGGAVDLGMESHREKKKSQLLQCIRVHTPDRQALSLSRFSLCSTLVASVAISRPRFSFKLFVKAAYIAIYFAEICTILSKLPIGLAHRPCLTPKLAARLQRRGVRSLLGYLGRL